MSLTEYSNLGIIKKNTVYYKNNQLRLDFRYNESGDITGNGTIYNSDGSVFIEQYYDDYGNKIGIYKSYYPNGNVMQEGEYAGVDYFQKKGEWRTYYKSGQLKTVISYDEDGNRIGEIIRHTENN